MNFTIVNLLIKQELYCDFVSYFAKCTVKPKFMFKKIVLYQANDEKFWATRK